MKFLTRFVYVLLHLLTSILHSAYASLCPPVLPQPWEALRPHALVLLPWASLTAQQYIASYSCFLVFSSLVNSVPFRRLPRIIFTSNIISYYASEYFFSHLLLLLSKNKNYVTDNPSSFNASSAALLLFFLVGGSRVWLVYPLFLLVLIIFCGF